MAQERDLRKPAAQRGDRRERLEAMASEVSDHLPGAHRVRIARFDSMTGAPSLIKSDAAPAEKGNYVQRAMQHMQQIDRALGFASAQPSEFTPDPTPQSTSSGAVAVHMRQNYKGVPVFQAAATVRFAPDGAMKETASSNLATIDQDLPVDPVLDAAEAVRRAAEHVAEPDPDEALREDPFGEPMEPPTIDLEGFEPVRLSLDVTSPQRPCVFEAGPFGATIPASLVWFPMEASVRLGWVVVLTMPDLAGQYRIVVDARDGEILYCRQLVDTVAARGLVYRTDGASAREMTDFPRDPADYGLPLPGGLPDGFPDDWVEDERTVGNCVDAHLGASGGSLQGREEDGILTFDPDDPVGDDQKVLNIFYYNCVMHDYFYLLGFTELAGNFQRDNLGRGGRSFDRVDARAHSGPVFGTANMLTLPDGTRPIMNMGLVTSTQRHTAFDSSVVFHEFMHGVTNRLVGGALDTQALEADQSGGMGEGWGDYVACTINDSTVVGDWVVDRPGGIRGFPYDSDFPDSFADLGTGRYTEAHDIGEIWCATLMEMNRAIGKVLGLQLVVDALMLSPANPSFLDMRDAILAALEDKRQAGALDPAEHADLERRIWRVFARFGMGPEAISAGPSLGGIEADFEPPAEPTSAAVTVDSSPGLPIPDRDPAGVRDALQVAETFIVGRVTVAVDIAHTFVGDLRVSLVSPAGTAVRLHDGTGGGQDDLVRVYTNENKAALGAVVGEPADGEWTLEVADLLSQDVGTLRAWSLTLEGS